MDIDFKKDSIYNLSKGRKGANKERCDRFLYYKNEKGWKT